MSFNGNEVQVPDEDAPNYPDDWHGQTVLPCAILSAAIATFFVVCRFYTRGVLLRKLGKEDWYILVSLIFTLGTMAGTIAMIRSGLGRHWDWLPSPERKGYRKAQLFSNILYTVSLTFTKVSILCLYLRVFKYEHIHAAAKIMLGIVIISHTYIICDLLTSCVPLNAYWDMGMQASGEAYCHSRAIYWSNFGLHIATDFLIFMLPLPVISKLRIPRKQKIGVFVVFLLAFGVCAISIVRMVQFLNYTRGVERLDITVQTIGMANWSMIEVAASIVCACLTTLKPLLVRIFPAFSSSRAPSPDENWEEPEYYNRPLTIGTKPSREIPVRRPRSGSFGSYTDFGADHKDAASPSPENSPRAKRFGFPVFSPGGRVNSMGDSGKAGDGEYMMVDVESGLRTPTSARTKPPPSSAGPPIYSERDTPTGRPWSTSSY